MEVTKIICDPYTDTFYVYCGDICYCNYLPAAFHGWY